MNARGQASPEPRKAGLVAVDWGTTSFRAALLDAQGQVLEERSAPQGILQVPPGQFASVLIANCAGWMRCSGTFCLISGMAGSRQGWREAPYCPCPARFADIARSLTWLDDWEGPGQVALVPGLSCEREAPAHSQAGVAIPDVMRGEETQVFGALDSLSLSDAQFVLPGTHSKWVAVRGGRIERFHTFMTGEVYALLRTGSILARGMPEGSDDPDDAAFMQGLLHARDSGGLLGAAFGARTLALFDRLPATALPSYLSGLVIGDELRARAPAAGSEVHLIGAAQLCARYASALAVWEVDAHIVPGNPAWAGLHAIAREIA